MEAESFFDKIKPPRPEDAGLEDCALPPDSIKEAFLKAASAVRSIVTSGGEEGKSEGRCVEDPWEASSDTLVGITEGVTSPREGCAPEKGGGATEAPGDKVAVGGGDVPEKADAVVGSDLPEAGEACVDGLQGLEIGGKREGSLGKKLAEEKDGGDEGEEEGDKEKPILAEGHV